MKKVKTATASRKTTKKTTKKSKKKPNFRVTIFGSARIKDSSKAFKDIQKIAEHLGAKGMDVITGGGPGMMKAGSKGHTIGKKRGKNHSKSIGLSIILPHEQESNKFLDEEYKFKRFSKRLDKFIQLSNMFIVAPGGFGTLLEFFYAIQLIQVKQTCNTPIILFGDMWDPLVDWIEKYPLKRGLISPQDMHPIFIAKNTKEVMKMADKAQEKYEEGDENYCTNFEKYKLY